jgi:hypothetical protein
VARRPGNASAPSAPPRVLVVTAWSLLLGVLVALPARNPAAARAPALDDAERWLHRHGGAVALHHDTAITDLYSLQVAPGAGAAFLGQVLATFHQAHLCRSDREVLIGVFDDEASALHFGRIMLGAITDVGGGGHVDIRPHWLAGYSSDQWFPDGPRRPYGWVGPAGKDSAAEIEVTGDLGRCATPGGRHGR